MHMRKEPPLQTVMVSVFRRGCLGFVVRWLLLGQYLCFSGLFLYERGWGQHNTQGHKQGARRLQPFKTDNVSQLSDFIKQGLTINPLNTRALLFYFIIFFYFPRQLAKVADGLIPSNISLCGTHMSFHPVHFGSVGIRTWQLVSCIRSHAYGVTTGTLLSCMCVHKSMQLCGFVFHTKSSFFEHEW